MYRHIHPTDSAAVKHEKKVSSSETTKLTSLF